MAKKTIRDIDLAGRRILMRCDFNVPLDSSGNITDDTRILGALPSIRHLSGHGAKVILCSHLGRPGGEVKPEFSLKPVARRLGELLGMEVGFVASCTGDEAMGAVEGLQDGELLLLENVRFHQEEVVNDAGFASRLANGAEVFVNDAFGTAHRAHASTVGVGSHVNESVMGLLMERELKYLSEELEAPQRPFVIILGGKKVSDKIGVINALFDKADAILIGGAMQYAFRKAQGHNIGESYVVEEDIVIAGQLLDKAGEQGVNLLLPADSLEADDFSDDAATNNISPYAEGGGIRDGWEGLDIGEKAIEEFCQVISRAKSIVWNGPMGVFEMNAFSRGTKAIAQAVADSDAMSVIGGGDSVTAVKKFGFAENVTFISTGGGASLELLEGRDLPGVSALDELD
ncbi:MAG: phosphoglycerate kinase [Verrucomicrobiaceae bacterium]|nr:phosphoglycerate kinase [Verrucomicrobiaceae bacterium]